MTSAAAGMVMAAMLCAGCGSSKPAAATARGQARWLVAAAQQLPIPGAQVRAHFDAAFLSHISPAGLNQALAAVGAGLGGSGSVRLASIQTPQPGRLVATVSRTGLPPRLTVSLTLDRRGQISSLLFRPLTRATPTTWRAIDRATRSVAPHVRLLVADLTGGSCRVVHAVDASAPAPLGSTFKLYVLDALGQAIAAHRLSWNQPLTVTARLKSLPSGELQNDPDGTQVSVQAATDELISISDNTAADILSSRLGQEAMRSALTTAGTADPARDLPFLTPRELFILKLDQWPALARRYLTAGPAGRRALLAAIDAKPLPSLATATSWTTPRDIDSIEWFASARDICGLYGSLLHLAHRPGLAPLSGALALNDGGLGLNPARWKLTWFKGGSEPGVLTLAYLATTRSGHTYVVTVLAENRSAPIDEATATPVLLSAVKSAFILAAAG